jgi:FkbM family methyltransferase
MAGRAAPSTLRYLASRTSMERFRWKILSALTEDAACRGWLASLENPTRTRGDFSIFTIPDDITSDCIKLFGQHETGTERFVLDHLSPGGTFLDIGANIGYFSLLAASNGSSVVAFEPQAWVADLLRKSAAHNGLGGLIRVEPIALSNESTVLKMTSCPGNTGHSQLAAPNDAGVQSFDVAVMPFDTWVEENPVGKISVCKIDTEGAELQVLQGMKKTLERDVPAVVIEVIGEYLSEFGASEGEVLAAMEALGYKDVSERYLADEDRNRYFVRK